MKAIILKEAGRVENFIYTEIPRPKVQQDEVLVRVKAISINPVDVKARANEGVLSWIYNDKRPVVLGWDISGEIVEKGNSVKSFQIGNEVFGMVNFKGEGKAYAEFVSSPASQLALKPQNISHEEAAASTLAALTAWQSLVTIAKIKKGQKVLIHAGSGGVGHFAIQIAKHLGAYVITTTSYNNKDFVLSLGVDEHIDYNSENFYEKVSGIDFVLDTIGGDTLLQSIKTVKPNGKIITLIPGLEPEIIEIAKRVNVELSFMLVQSNGNDMKSLSGLLNNNHLKPHIYAKYPFSEMGKAHLQLETCRTVGKVVVTI